MIRSVSQPPSSDFILRGWHVLVILITFFAVVIGVDVGFSIVAVRTFPGEDIKNSYVQGNQYNETLADRARQSRLGWRAQTRFLLSAGAPAVALTLRDRDGRPIEGAVVTGRLRRPATTAQDRALTFAAGPDGRYVATSAGLAAGVWDLDARATKAGEPFDIQARMTWIPEDAR